MGDFFEGDDCGIILWMVVGDLCLLEVVGVEGVWVCEGGENNGKVVYGSVVVGVVGGWCGDEGVCELKLLDVMMVGVVDVGWMVLYLFEEGFGDCVEILVVWIYKNCVF